MAEVKLTVKVERSQVDRLQQDIDKLNNTPINIKTRTDGVDRLRQEVDEAAKSTERLATNTNNISNTTNIANSAYINVSQTLNQVVREGDTYNTQIIRITQNQRRLNDLTRQGGTLHEILGRSLSHFVIRMTVYRTYYDAIRKITSGFKEALQTMRDVDSELVTVRKVTGFDSAQMAQVQSDAYSVATKYGADAADYVSGVAEFARAGYRDLSSQLAELSLKTQIVGDTTADVANQFLLSVDAAYKYKGSVESLQRVLDGANELDNKYATSIQKIAEGMGIVAPVAAQMNVGIDELAASIGTITAVTQRSGSETARALRALYLNIVGDTKTEIDEGVTWTTGEIEGLRDIIKVYAKDAYDAAQATGGIIDPMEAIAGLAKSVKDGILSEAELMEMVSDIGGKLRTSQLLALINNWDMYESMLADYRDAAGSADKEIENALDSWERKANQLKNTWTEFVQNGLDSNDFKKAIDALRWLVSGIGSLNNGIVILGGTMAALNATAMVRRITMTSEAVSQLGGGFRNLINVVRTYSSSQREATRTGQEFTAQTLAQDAANRTAGASFNWLGLVIGGLTVAYTIYTVAKNKAKEAHEKEVQATYEAAEQAKSHTDNLMQAYVETVKADSASEHYTETLSKMSDVLGRKLPDDIDTAIGKIRQLTEEQLLADRAATNTARITAAGELVEAISGSETITDKVNRTWLYQMGKPNGINIPASSEAYGMILGLYQDPRFYDTVVDSGTAGGYNYGNTFFERVKFDKDDVETAIAYRNAIQDIVTSLDEYAYETGDSSVLDTDIYKQYKKFLSETNDELEKYNSLVAQQLEQDAIIQVASDLRTTTIDSKEAFDAYIASIQDSTEYSDDFKNAMIQMAQRYYPEFVDAVEESVAAVDKETDSLYANQKALDANATASERAAAAKKDAEAAARRLIPVLFDESGALTDVGKAALNADANLAAMVQAELEAQQQASQANYSNMIAQIATVNGAAATATANLLGMIAAAAALNGAATQGNYTTLSANYVAQSAAKLGMTTQEYLIWALQKDMQDKLNHMQTSIGAVSAYIPASGSSSSSGRTGGGSSGSSGSSKSTEDPKLTALKDRLSLLKSELSLMQERGDEEDDQITKMREIMSALHDQAEYLRSIGGDQVTINNLSQEWWSYHNKIADMMDKEAQAAQDQADALQAALDAQLALNNALRDRSVRYYNADTGQWEWSANADNVAKAREALESAVEAAGFDSMDAWAMHYGMTNAINAIADFGSRPGGLSGNAWDLPVIHRGNTSSTTIGNTNNYGNTYQIGNVTMSEAEAKSTSIYDFARTSRNLVLYSSTYY